ncbi:MAG TPA: tetratricopeptide repeat protein [Planctomycetota bacterium]|nr:tetratricopeptide repeat protein [Planctomycetota bacterium]
MRKSCPLLLVLACALAARAEQPLFEGLGHHHRAVTHASAEAQKYFDQALTWTFAFNHDEAIRSYEAAAALSPDCAMAWWGIALCHGPHINNTVVPPERAKAAWEALQKALALTGKASPVEAALIGALAKRYAEPQPADRKPLDEAYAAAMREVYGKFPDDVDVGTLYAESLMDLQPWDLWTKDGKPKGRTEEVMAVLEKVMAKQADHPGATHLYIHTVENSPFPEKGNAAAETLRALVPASSHLVHMPGHIYVQTGRWAEAAAANERAILADAAYRKISPKQGFYAIYMAHNHQFLSWVAMMQGRCAKAVEQARAMVAGVPPEFVEASPASVDGYLPIQYEVLIRFGKWDEMLREPAPSGKLPILTAFWHLCRGLSFAAKDEIEDALAEQAKFRAVTAKIPAETIMAINPACSVLAIADRVLAGEIALAREDLDAAASELREAVKLEDALTYMEPPDWLVPTRHTLGAVLVKAKRFEEAEKVYREDLVAWPENGWALYGLARCLKALGRDEEAASVQKRFEAQWSEADTKLGSTCLCVD